MRFIFGDSKVTEIVVKPEFKIEKKESKEYFWELIRMLPKSIKM